MSVPLPREPRGGDKRRPNITTAVVWGLLAVVSSGGGIWLSVRKSAEAPASEQRLIAGTPRFSVLIAHASPQPLPEVRFEDGGGHGRTLADFRGRVVLLNVWATWCSPCRREMPTLDRLQAGLGSRDFEVIALSIDRGGVPAVKSFYDEIDVQALAIYVDATTEAQAKLGVIGVPTTLLIDPDGREVARYAGPAEWDRNDVVATIERYLPRTPTENSR